MSRALLSTLGINGISAKHIPPHGVAREPEYRAATSPVNARTSLYGERKAPCPRKLSGLGPAALRQMRLDILRDLIDVRHAVHAE